MPETDTATSYDVVILGAGPAGLQAAVHAVRKKVRVLVFGKTNHSSLYAAHVENYFSLIGISGSELLARGKAQAEGFGVAFMEEDVLSVATTDTGFDIVTESGRTITAFAVIMATGTHRNKLGVPGEREFLGKGVSYCVDCDGMFFRGQVVCVIGGKSAAVDGALTLSRIADRVNLVCDELNVPAAMIRNLDEAGVDVRTGAKVTAITGTDAVEAVTLDPGGKLPATGVFIELGAKGILELALPLGVQLDDDMKYVKTDRKQATSVPGVFAAGDVCGPPWQMAKAVGEGCVAGLEAASFAKRAAAK